MASWPGTLPSAPLIAGFKETPENLVIRTEMDQGPAKVRKRSTAGVRVLEMQFSMSDAQVAALDTFIVTTINGGADSFTFTHPRTSVSGTFRITRLPEYNAIAPDLWRVSLAMELLP